MTVTELLERIVRIYPGATPEALASFRPVFVARLQHREAHLEAAANEVFASFQPKGNKPFPIPIDFEAHMPSLKAIADAKDGPIRQALQDRAHRAESLYRDWHANQGAKIKAARPLAVYGQCVMLAKDLANKATERTPRIVLTAEQIADCDLRAVSSARVAKFGRLPESEETWRQQITAVREAWASGETIERRPDGEPGVMTSTGMLKRLAELAQAKREGKPAPERRDIAEAYRP